MSDRKTKFIKDMAEYISTSPNYNEWDTDAAVKTTLQVLVHDIGAAQSFLNAVGINVDIYTYDFFMNNKDKVAKTIELTTRELLKIKVRSGRRGFVLGAASTLVVYRYLRAQERKKLLSTSPKI